MRRSITIGAGAAAAATLVIALWPSALNNPHSPIGTSSALDSSLAPSLSPRSFVPTATSSTPAPVTPGSNAWERIEYDLGVPVIAWDMWTVGDHFVAIAERDTPDDPAWLFLSSTDARTWQVAVAPEDVEEIFFRTGTVVDGRLWFVARGHGDVRRLIGTSTGADWERLDPAQGLRARDGASFLASVGGRWFAGPFRETPSEPFPLIDQDVRISSDGVHWSVADAPRRGSFPDYHEAHVLGDRVLVGGTWYGPELQQDFFASSATGRSWRAANFTPARNTDPGDIACGSSRCVMVGRTTDDDHRNLER